MVKVQKPNPKTLQQDSSKKAKNMQIKKTNTKQKNDTKSKKTSGAISTQEIQLIKGAAKPLPEKSVTKKKASKNAKAPLQKDAAAAVVEKEKKTTTAKSAVVAQSEEALNPKKAKKMNKKPVANAKSKKETENQPPLDKAQKRKAAIKAFKKSKKMKRDKGAEKTEKPIPPVQFETVPFDEDKFNAIVSLENLKKNVAALKELVEKEVNEKKTSIFTDYKYFLNVSSYKIPNCPKRMVKLNLQHSLVDTTLDDVCIIVPDLQRGAKVDYEPTIQHYEDLLREIGVTNLKIVPFNQLRNECTSFEAKRKFANTYDFFLCDGRIVSHVVGFCGKHFQKPRTTFHAVRLDNPKTYKSDIEHALKRTSYKQLEKGDLISIPVGNHRFNAKQLAENMQSVIEQLRSIYPGGYPNIRNIHMKIDIQGTSSLPLYVNLAGAPLETPHVTGLREQRMLKLKKEANDILSKFSLSKTGEIIKLNKAQVKRKQQIKEAKEALSKESNATNEEVPAASTSKKVRKATHELEKKLKTQSVEAEESDEDNADEEIGEDASEDDSEDENIDEELSADDAEEESDDDEDDDVQDD